MREEDRGGVGPRAGAIGGEGVKEWKVEIRGVGGTWRVGEGVVFWGCWIDG